MLGLSGYLSMETPIFFRTKEWNSHVVTAWGCQVLQPQRSHGHWHLFRIAQVLRAATSQLLSLATQTCPRPPCYVCEG